MHKNSISYNQELIRKALHLSSLWMPFMIWHLSYVQSLLLFGVLLVLALCYEFLRLRNIEVGFLYKELAKFIQPLLRAHEDERGVHRNLTGATYMLVAVFLAILIFPKLIVVTSLVIMLIGDSFAAIIGRKLGKHGYRGKSWIGSLAFIISSIIAVTIIAILLEQGAHYLLSAYAAVVAGMLAEKFLPIDDNFGIAMASSLVLYALI
jgi:dolichol kinase